MPCFLRESRLHLLQPSGLPLPKLKRLAAHHRGSAAAIAVECPSRLKPSGTSCCQREPVAGVWTNRHAGRSGRGESVAVYGLRSGDLTAGVQPRRIVEEVGTYG